MQQKLEIINTPVDFAIVNLLLPYQLEHLQNQIYAIKKHHICLDASDTGTGKTFVNVALAKQLGYRPFIICPKSVIKNWEQVLSQFQIRPLGIVNYETIRNGKWYTNKNYNKRDACPYVTKNDFNYHWNFPKKTLIIFDEAHKSKNTKTINNKLMMSLRVYLGNDLKMSLLSASICDKRMTIKYIAYMLKLYEINTTNGKLNTKAYKQWIQSMIKNYGNQINNDYNSQSHSTIASQNNKLLNKVRDKYLFSHIHGLIFPEHGSRMQIQDIKKMYSNSFNSELVHPECFKMDEKTVDAINQQYSLINNAIQDLKNKSFGETHPLTVILRARQQIELLKIPIIVDLAKSFLTANTYSVVIFVNFTETIKLLYKKLRLFLQKNGLIYCGELFDIFPPEIVVKIHSYIGGVQLLYGNQTLQERQYVIDSFQKGETRLIIANIAVGSIGLSLHDTIGNQPRVSIINLNFSAVDLLQTLGRITRANAKSDALQIIACCDGTIENEICDNIRHKLKNISLLNDNDFIGKSASLPEKEN